jgi:hypothetical protein
MHKNEIILQNKDFSAKTGYMYYNLVNLFIWLNFKVQIIFNIHNSSRIVTHHIPRHKFIDAYYCYYRWNFNRKKFTLHIY